MRQKIFQPLEVTTAPAGMSNVQGKRKTEKNRTVIPKDVMLEIKEYCEKKKQTFPSGMLHRILLLHQTERDELYKNPGHIRNARDNSHQRGGIQKQEWQTNPSGIMSRTSNEKGRTEARPKR